MLPAALAFVVGCGRSDDGGPPLIARERVTRPRQTPGTPMRPLTPAAGAPPIAAPAPTSSPGTELRLGPSLSIDARALVITTDGTDAAFEAITSTLGYLGTPYDVLNATTGPALTAAALADGDHGRYQAIFLDVGDLSDNGTSAFTTDEWTALAAYEARFSVRRVALYTYPSAAYGLVPSGGSVNPATTPIQTHCSAAGATALVGTNCANAVTIDAGWAYPARAADAQTVPLLSDDAGNVFAAIHTDPAGRETLALTFAQASYVFHTLQLGYGLVHWATRGLFIGERHAYLCAQIDDLFLASTIYPETGVTYRMTGADMQTLASWQNARRANPMVAGLRLGWAANLQGSHGVANDALTAAAVALGPAFSWISHTWDHADLTNMSYANAYTEFSLNDQAIRGLGLAPYETTNLVTPGITGLGNVNAMQAAYDVGIRYLVSDTSIAGQDNPTPNAGRWNALVPGILEIPRYPTDLDYDVSLPSEWIAATLGRENRQETYDAIVDKESRVLAGHLLRGANDPWMFHQANTRDFGGGRSLLGDLLGATIDRYLASATFPIVSPNMEELAARVLDRMRFDAAGVSATIEPGDQLTVRVANAARVPLTGVCTPNAESYGGQKITYLDLPAGGSATLSLADCTGSTTGTGGAGGASGAGGTCGAGTGGTGTGGNAGTTGAAGTSGNAGATGGAGTSGSAGATGSAGTSGNAGTTGAAGTSGNAGTTGAAGISGNAGTSGAAGTSGNAGTTGAAGTSGNAGTTGGAGTGGYAGTTGGAGTSGNAGTTGGAGMSGNGGTSATGNGGTAGGATGGGGANGNGGAGASGGAGTTGNGGANASGKGGTSGGAGATGRGGTTSTALDAGATGEGGQGGAVILPDAGDGRPAPIGCDCATGGPPASGGMLAVFAGALVLLRRRRR